MVTELDNSVNSLKEELQEVKEGSEALQKSFTQQVDRSMRNSFVISGIKEDENETWDMTEELVSDLLSRHLLKGKETIRGMLQRVHRGNGNDKKTIYANLHSWKDAQSVLKEFTDLRINNRNLQIKIDQMYSTNTMNRRNDALIGRKKLIADGTFNVEKAHLVETHG